MILSCWLDFSGECDPVVDFSNRFDGGVRRTEIERGMIGAKQRRRAALSSFVKGQKMNYRDPFLDLDWRDRTSIDLQLRRQPRKLAR